MASDLTTVLVFCMAALVLLEGVIQVVALTMLERQLHRWAVRLEASQAAVGGTLQAASHMLSRVALVTVYLPTLERQTNRLLDQVSGRLQVWDEAAARGLAKATEGLDATSRRIEYGLVQFTRQTSLLSRKVQIPAMRLSAMIKGVQAGVDAWRRGRRVSPLMDDENFI